MSEGIKTGRAPVSGVLPSTISVRSIKALSIQGDHALCSLNGLVIHFHKICKKKKRERNLLEGGNECVMDS